uniref:Uncharacterized protein n=1 Tax=Avena sativa TaxID=4498 RepID=A0ACD5Y8D3_AVESA
MKWRDWKNLPTDLIEDIAGRLLTFDVAEYLRFRAACKPWRACTNNPRMGDGMHARFRPRDWIVLNRCGKGCSSRRTLVNVATGARANVHFPELATHHQLGTADGLLVLAHKSTNDVSLLNPLTGALNGFPSLSIDQYMPSRYAHEPSSFPVTWFPVASAISGAGIDDSTSPRTLVLCLRARWHAIVCAKSGDEKWVYGHHGVTEQRSAGEVRLVRSPVTFGGRCYFTTEVGAVMTVDLSQVARCPKMRFLLEEDPTVNTEISSFLVRSQGRMLMVRYMFGANLLEGGGYEETEIFMWNGRPSRVEVFEVDIAGRRLVAQSGVGDDRAAFLSGVHTVMVSTKKFPKIAANSVYLNNFLRSRGHFGAYHFEDGTTMPPRVFLTGRHPSCFPCACHWELQDYLVGDIEKGFREGLTGSKWHRESHNLLSMCTYVIELANWTTKLHNL